MSKENPFTPYGVRIPKQYMSKLTKISSRDHRTISELIREAIRLYLVGK